MEYTQYAEKWVKLPACEFVCSFDFIPTGQIEWPQLIDAKKI